MPDELEKEDTSQKSIAENGETYENEETHHEESSELISRDEHLQIENHENESDCESEGNEIEEFPEELIELLDDKENAPKILKAFMASRRESFSGPLPHPRILKGYEDIQNGLADRIVVMAERQQLHRIGVVDNLVAAEIRQSSTGLWMGFILALIFLIGGVIMIITGKDATGWFMLVASVGGMVALFVKKTIINNQSNNQKKDEEEE